MAMNWDVESYRTEYESEEHWELRKNFMLAHKHSLPEDEVVCLSQVFVNIELLGCRYPDETMRKVAELAKGLVETYRKKKENCLKRTFVAASDAAASKVTGHTGHSGGGKKRRISFLRKIKCELDFTTKPGCDNVKKPAEDDARFSGPSQSLVTVGNQPLGSQPSSSYNFSALIPNFNYTSCTTNIKTLEDLKTSFVFFLYDEPPVCLLERNASLNKGILRWDFEGPEGQKKCLVYYNGLLLGTSERCAKKLCKERAARAAIATLQSLCYTVKIKPNTLGNKVTPAALGYPDSETALKSEIGEQIMRLMGWSGGGLGVKQQGIVKPINLCSNFGRDGLGLSRMKENRAFRSRAYSFLRNWVRSDTEEDLVFSNEFTRAQREILHKVASDLNLKSKSYGKDEGRYMVIHKKPVPWLIVEKLIKVGGSTDRYELVIPSESISQINKM